MYRLDIKITILEYLNSSTVLDWFEGLYKFTKGSVVIHKSGMILWYAYTKSILSFWELDSRKDNRCPDRNNPSDLDVSLSVQEVVDFGLHNFSGLIWLTFGPSYRRRISVCTSEEYSTHDFWCHIVRGLQKSPTYLDETNFVLFYFVSCKPFVTHFVLRFAKL